LDSEFVGSVRDLPQISSRFGCPSTTIYITTKGLDLSKEFITQYNTGQKHKEKFFINYSHPQSGEQTYPSRLGIKLLEIKDY
jgi:hypothetical protein